MKKVLLALVFFIPLLLYSQNKDSIWQVKDINNKPYASFKIPMLVQGYPVITLQDILDYSVESYNDSVLIEYDWFKDENNYIGKVEVTQYNYPIKDQNGLTYLGRWFIWEHTIPTFEGFYIFLVNKYYPKD